LDQIIVEAERRRLIGVTGYRSGALYEVPKIYGLSIPYTHGP
jgi:hypothetical protein